MAIYGYLGSTLIFVLRFRILISCMKIAFVMDKLPLQIKEHLFDYPEKFVTSL